MNVRTTALCMIVIFFHEPVSGAAQYDYDRSLLLQYKRAVENTFQLVREQSSPFLSRDQRVLLANTVLRIEMENWDVRATRVNPEAGQPTISIPIGLVVLQDHLDSAMVIGELSKIDRSVLMDYVAEFARVVRLNDELAAQNQALTSLPQFPVYSRLPSSQLQEIMKSRDYANLKELVKSSSFAFLFLHEFAHLYWPKEHVKTREISADIFAARIATQADLSPLLAQMTFYFFAAMEGDQGLEEPMPNYPAPLCRGVHFLYAGRAQAEADPEFVAYAKRNGLWADWLRMFDDLDQALKNDINCPDLNELQKSGLPSPVQPKKRRYRLVMQLPTPGLCNGMSMIVTINGRQTFEIDNTRDTSPVQLETVVSGSNRFKFSEIATYCIHPQPPYRMQRQSFNGKCEGTFVAGETNDLLLFSKNAPLVGLECGIY